MIGVDETSVNIAGTAHWLHVARTDTLTAYHCHESRGRKAVQEFGILPAYTGTVVHDALSVYDCYPATHALCGAHLIRELTAAAEAHPDQHWQAQARSALAELADLAAQARADGLTFDTAPQGGETVAAVSTWRARRTRRASRADGREQTKTRNLLASGCAIAKRRSCASPKTSTCPSRTTVLNATCGRSRHS